MITLPLNFIFNAAKVLFSPQFARGLQGELVRFFINLRCVPTTYPAESSFAPTIPAHITIHPKKQKSAPIFRRGQISFSLWRRTAVRLYGWWFMESFNFQIPVRQSLIQRTDKAVYLAKLPRLTVEEKKPILRLYT